MKSTTIALIAGMAVGVWIAQANGSEPAAADPADDESAAAATEAAAAEESEESEEFEPPPGFAKKKHGKHILYCKRDTTIGTRFKTERCYSEEQMRDYMIALEENKVDIDRMRNICSNPCVCGQPC